jgi:uncharacterized protein (TIGR00725 family)
MRHSIKDIRLAYNPIITVYGSSTCKEGSKLYDQTINIGKMLSNLHFTVASGGYTCTMDAISRGASLEGGKVIGITTDEITKVNPSVYLSEEFRETNLMTRIDLLHGIADAHLCLAGSTGTLSELSILWDKQKLGLLPIRPIFLLYSTWHSIYDLLFKKSDIPKSQWKLDDEVENNTHVVTSAIDLRDQLLRIKIK